MQVFRAPSSHSHDDDFDSDEESDASRLSGKRQPTPRRQPKAKAVPKKRAAASSGKAAGGGANPRTPQFTPSDLSDSSDSNYSEEVETPDSQVSTLSNRTHPVISQPKGRPKPKKLFPGTSKRGTASPQSGQKTPVSRTTPKGRTAKQKKRGQCFDFC